MGTDKAFLHVGSDQLIERQLRCLREAGVDELLISGRAGGDYSRLTAKVLHDDFPNAGPLAGVAAALKACSSCLVFVLAVDMPRMTSAMVAKILARCKDMSGCVPMDHHGFQPLGAVYPVSLLPLAEHLLQTGKHSMQEFAGLALREGLIRTFQLEAADHIHYTNINYPHEWAQIQVG